LIGSAVPRVQRDCNFFVPGDRVESEPFKDLLTQRDRRRKPVPTAAGNWSVLSKVAKSGVVIWQPAGAVNSHAHFCRKSFASSQIHQKTASKVAIGCGGGDL
jgi:hypothetical protein